MTLPEFLFDLSRRRWEWGQCDCLLALADWIRAKHGVDLGASRRGTYTTERECEELLTREGGILAFVCRIMADNGFDQTETATAGNIGLVYAPTSAGIQLTGAIAVNERSWALLTPDKGLVITPMRVAAIWNV